MVDLDMRPLTPAIGAEIQGVDLRDDLDDATIAAIRSVLVDRCVVFFRDQHLTDAEHLRFARRFAPVQRALVGTTSQEEPDVSILDMTSPTNSGTDVWHADHTVLPSPPLGSVLRAVRIPPVGGDTCFASMGAAYGALDAALQVLLDQLTAVHSSALVDAQVRALRGDVAGPAPPAETWVHPVVRVHPESHRKVLFVNSVWVERIVELEREASDALLAFLYRHVTAPEFQCRFRWTPGSVAFWDNRSCQHYAVSDYAERRVMHRVMLEGDVPRGVARAAVPSA